MKTLTISEYAYILHRYDGEITITDAEYNQLKNGEIDAKFLANKYDIAYDGDSEPFYEDSMIDSYEINI